VKPADGLGSPTPALHVALVHPEIAWNTGNVGRTCLGFGAALHLIEPLGFGLDDRRVRRAGLDYWSRVDLTVWPTWSAFEAQAFELGTPYAFTGEGQLPIWEADLRDDCVLIFGSETRGLPRTLRAHDAIPAVHIPMRTESIRAFNVSTTVGMVLLEAERQRAAPPRRRA